MRKLSVIYLDCTHLALPYPVEEENGSAKFDKSKRRLIVTLPVLPPPVLSVHTPVVGELQQKIVRLSPGGGTPKKTDGDARRPT